MLENFKNFIETKIPFNLTQFQLIENIILRIIFVAV